LAVAVALASAGLIAPAADAGVVLKANNTDPLNLDTSWVGGVAPGSGDVAAWDSTVTAANATALGADLSWQGIQVTNPGGAVTIGAGNTLTLGSGGIDMSAATQNATLNNAVTVGASQAWNVGASRLLVVAGGLGGSDATMTVTKSGAGEAWIQGTNTFAGGIKISQGQLTLGGGVGTATITLADGTTLDLDRPGASNAASIFAGNAVAVDSGASVTMTSDSAGNGYSGSVTGDAASTFVISNGGGAQVSFSAGSSIRQFGNFLGTVRIASGGSIRFSSTSGVNNGGENATFDVLGSLETRNGATVHLGALTGNGSVKGPSGGDGTVTYVVGEKNLDTTFDGTITEGNTTARHTNVQKAGTGTLTLTGANTYAGTTTVNGGTLLVNGTHTGAGNYTVAAAGTLGGTGSITLTADTNTVTVNGKLTPGSATAIESLDILTGSLALAGTADFQVDLAAGQADKVNVGNVLTYGGALNVAFSGTGADGSAYDLFDFSSETGTFSQVNFTGLAPTQTASFDPATGVVTIASAAVPEPAALSLIGLAAVALGGRRRRK
jgi:autotransporter-associated beta strand protein